MLRKIYNLNPKLCLNCNAEIIFEKKTNNFCNHSCSASYNNSKREFKNKEKRTFSEEALNNIRKSNNKRKKKEIKEIKYKSCKVLFKLCIYCTSIFATNWKNKNRKSCFKNCKQKKEKRNFVTIYNKRKIISEEEFYSKKRTCKTYEKYLIVREIQSQNILKRYKDGWDSKCGRAKKYDYNSPIAGKIKVDGTWELKVCKYLDENKINWRRNNKRFAYKNENNKTSTYKPDFFIYDWDSYLEVKGCKTSLDLLKWAQFTEKLIIWEFKELKDRNIL